MPDKPEYQNYPNDEINLMDYIKVIIKRKKLIIGIFLICVVAAVIYSLTVVPVYKMTQILEVPTIGENVYLDSSSKIKEKIEGGFYNFKILENLDFESKYNINNIGFFKVTIPKENQLLSICADVTKQDLENSKKVLSELFAQMDVDYSLRLEAERGRKNTEEAIKKNTIKSMDVRIEDAKFHIILLEPRIESLVARIEETKTNTEDIILEREKFINKQKIDGIVGSILYTTTIQQAINHLDQLDSELVSLRMKKLDKEKEIKNLLIERERVVLEIFNLDKQKESIRSFREIQPVSLSTNPIKPKKKQMIIISAVVGLMLGIFIAFFVEFWQKSKEDRQ